MFGGSSSLPVLSNCPVFSSGRASVHLHSSDNRVVVELLWHKVMKFIADIRLKQIRKSISPAVFCLWGCFSFYRTQFHQSLSPQTKAFLISITFAPCDRPHHHTVPLWYTENTSPFTPISGALWIISAAFSLDGNLSSDTPRVTVTKPPTSTRVSVSTVGGGQLWAQIAVNFLTLFIPFLHSYLLLLCLHLSLYLPLIFVFPSSAEVLEYEMQILSASCSLSP